MTTLTRALGKALLQSISSYESTFGLVEKASDPVKPTLKKSHAKFRAKLEDSYTQVCCDWQAYKADTNLSQADFNAVDAEGIPTIKHNDEWFENFQEKYIELIERSDEALEKEANEQRDASNNEETTTESKVDVQNARMGILISSQVDKEIESIDTDIKKLETEVDSFEIGALGPAKAEFFKSRIATLNERLNVHLRDLALQCFSYLDQKTAEAKNNEYMEFVANNRDKISEIFATVSERAKKVTVTSGSDKLDSDRTAQTFLKKMDPPKFDGDETTYPDFKRKWQAHVSKSNLSPESEIDRLRDNVPSQASKLLYGELTMEGAWKVLDELYGNKTIISNKLKNQLKNIKATGKEDYDIVINLAVDVKTIEKRLKALQLQKMLCYDDEYLSAVFKALPSSERLEWLKFNKTPYKFEWDAMTAFLDIAREKATATKVLLSCYGEQKDEKIKSGGKIKANAGGIKKINDDSSDDEDIRKSKAEKEKELRRKVREKCGKCPLCKDRHTFTRKRDGKEWPSDRFISCSKFQKMSAKDRGLQLEKSSGCSRCTSWSHKKDSCTIPSGHKCGQDLGNGSKCQSDHSRLVCGSGVAYCGRVEVKTNVAATDSSQDMDAETLLKFQDVKIENVEKEPTVCFDDGSNRCLIRNDFATENNLESQRIKYELSTPGGNKQIIEGHRYKFALVANDGQTFEVWAFGIDEIMPDTDEIDLSPIRHLFPHVPAPAFALNPSKKVEILIGTNKLSLHPAGGLGRDSVGDLRALQSKFGSGWVIAGTHPFLGNSSAKLSANASLLAKINRIDISPIVPESFWECESLGVEPPKKCGRCLNCSSCSDPGLILSRKNQEEYDILKSGVKLVDGQLKVEYQFQKDPYTLPNNREAAVRIAEKLERRLKQAGQLDYYNQEIQKILDRAAAVELTKEEMDNWSGPINYISHHGVEQPSVTTPLRIVTNSSLKNGGKSLNDCLIKGPNSLNSMFDIMLRFRCHESGLVFDLSKAYNSLKTGDTEKHLRRFIWRFDPDGPWKDFAFDSVHFGDCPAANFLEIGRDMTADAGRDIDEVAAEKIKNSSYVDDGVLGGPKADVDRMKGTRLADGTYDGTISRILARGKLKPKVIVTTGETDEEAMNLIGNKVLGYGWNATTDMLSVKFPVNVSQKKSGKVRSGPNLDVESLDKLKDLTLTRRMALGVTNSFHDFLGIACPFLLRFKLLMKEVFDSKKEAELAGKTGVSWDDKVADEDMQKWLDLIAEAVKAECLVFPRTTRPEGAIGNPDIPNFGDGSFEAFSAAVYVRWQIEEDKFEANLICAKARVTAENIPRVELNGGVLQTRLTLSVVRALQIEEDLKPVSVIPMNDSRCTISVIDKTTSSLKPYFHNRVSEIVENMALMSKYCEVEKFHHVATNLNPADLATRSGVKVEDIGVGSFWQQGPSFLASRRDLWPITRDFTKVELPEEEFRTKRPVIVAAAKSKEKAEYPRIWDIIEKELEFSNDIVKVKRIIARIVRGYGSSDKFAEIVKNDPTAQELAKAEKMMLVTAMPETVKAVEEGKLVSLVPEKMGSLVVTRGRLGSDALSEHLGVKALPILMPHTRLALLYMERAHCGEHGTEHKGIVETLARSRTSVWIHRGRDLAKKVCKNCPRCKLDRKTLCGQQMAKIRPEFLTVCRPWTYVALDFAGPFKIRGVVNPRTRIKCWVIVYVCCSTKAVCLLPTYGYSTQNFLIRHEEFIARKGAPTKIISDRGTQLVSAGRILAAKDSPESWDWKRITSENATSTWEFVPVGSQHRNGLSEATVKVLKRSLEHAINPGVVLDYGELVTLLARISYSVNQRPLGLGKTSESSLQDENLLPLTPNMILLGRNSNESPPLEYSSDERLCTRLAYVAEVESQWWAKWVKEVMPTLLPYTKWKKEQTNLRVGDVVLMEYKGNVKDDYRRAVVTEVFPDPKGLVRTVTVRYRQKVKSEPPDKIWKNQNIKEKVAVQRLYYLGLAEQDTAHYATSDHADKIDDHASKISDKDLKVS